MNPVCICTAKGCWLPNEHGEQFAINYSEILTCLIKEAARCRRCSGDLFFEWRDIDLSLQNKNLSSNKYLFGFRETGIDNTYFVKKEGIESEKYNSVYQLDINVYYPELKMALYKLR